MQGTLTGRCSSCGERHGDLCPPYEVRTTGVAWFRMYIEELETKIKDSAGHARLGKHMMTMLEGMTLPELTTEASAVDGYIRVYEKQRDEIKQLRAVLLTARIALDTCRASMTPLIRDGVHAQTTNSAAEQFAAAWRDLRKTVEAAEAVGGNDGT